jgi:ribosomal protein S1
MSELTDLELGFKRLKYGAIVSGTVVRVEGREILIDIGAKSEGIVEPKEVEKMSADALKKFQPGETVLAFVLRPENRDGNVVLSLARAQLEHDWREAEELLKSGAVFETQVAGFNKGGLIVRVGKVRGFVPATQLEGTYRLKVEPAAERAETLESDLSAYVGKKIKLKVIELDRERNRLILSERAALRDLRREQKDRLLEEVKVGATRVGTVTSVADFGVFVDLDGLDGLLHITDMSWGRINHPSAMFEVGHEVTVKVLAEGSQGLFGLMGAKPAKVLVDGNHLPRLDVLAEAIVKGDEKVPAISAASILAKVSRDRWCARYDEQFPQYGFAAHKGYGTAEHIRKIKKHGLCPIHRKSFCKKFVKKY